MDACTLNMLHDTGDKDILAVTDSIDLKLRAHKILVDQHGVLNALSKDYSHILLDIVIIEGDYHILSAENIGGSHKNRILDLICDLKSLLSGHYREALGTLDLVQLKKLIEALSVLGGVDRIGRCAEDIDALLCKVLGKLDSSLTAEGNNNAVGLFNVDDIHYVLIGERLEI